MRTNLAQLVFASRVECQDHYFGSIRTRKKTKWSTELSKKSSRLYCEQKWPRPVLGNTRQSQ